MAEFQPAMEVLDSWEGGYSNNPKDPGGETYCGISRRHWPNWEGWIVIDEIKKQRSTNIPVSNQGIKWNERFDNLLVHVNIFYMNNFWDKQSFSQLDNQDITNKIFQHYVNMGVRAIKFIQEEVNDELISKDVSGNTQISVDGQLGQKTVAAINDINYVILLDGYVQYLVGYYESLIAEHPQLKVFEHEWLLRARTIGKRPS